MLISPRTAIAEGWIVGDFTEDSIQPNAIDFTADRMFMLDICSQFVLRKDSKIMRKSSELTPVTFQDDIFTGWVIPMGAYDVVSNFYVKVPTGVAAMLIVRSTLNRNGLFVTSGLYDSGFEGNIGFALHNRGGDSKIEQGVRVGQIMFVESDSVGKYAGQYNTQNGQHWKDAIEDNK